MDKGSRQPMQSMGSQRVHGVTKSNEHSHTYKIMSCLVLSQRKESGLQTFSSESPCLFPGFTSNTARPLLLAVSEHTFVSTHRLVLWCWLWP